MKKIIGLCLVMLMTVGVVFAQDGRRDRNLLENGKDPRTEQIIRDLDLNADQAEAYRNLDNEYRDRMRGDHSWQDEQRDMQMTREQKREKMQNLENMRNERNQRMKNILDDDQYNRYLEMEKKNWENRTDKSMRNR
ncbi:MAG: hypothetical protein LUG51_05025 [Tannerellaceae bacterium]|nr:hypothetical protein [Tannerellaceae bacterium]